MLYLLAALAPEAKPLITHFRLQRQMQHSAFPVYRREHLWLIVTGVGQQNMAAASAYLYAIGGIQKRAAWLNLGVAGHAEFALGSRWLAHKVTDQVTGKNWYPPRVLSCALPSSELLTVARPLADYPEQKLYDMEAAGLFRVAGRYCELELVQSLKVISDNRLQPAHRLGGNQISDYISAALPDIENCLDALQTLLACLPNLQSDCETFLKHWRFSVTQQYRLQELLNAWRHLHGASPQPEEFGACRDAGDFLNKLSEQLSKAAILRVVPA